LAAFWYGHPQNPLGAPIHRNHLDVVVAVMEEMVKDAEIADDKETYPCREVESKW